MYIWCKWRELVDCLALSIDSVILYVGIFKLHVKLSTSGLGFAIQFTETPPAAVNVTPTYTLLFESTAIAEHLLFKSLNAGQDCTTIVVRRLLIGHSIFE
jgi:hypothetical protein